MGELARQRLCVVMLAKKNAGPAWDSLCVFDMCLDARLEWSGMDK